MRARHKLGIVGYGGMGSWHAENVRDRIGRMEIAGVYDIKPERGVQAERDGFRSFAGPEELFEGCDVVLVSTPNHFHADYAARAMRAGKAVVCEKPVCMNAAELQALIRLSEETGTLLTAHQNRRWDIDYEIVRQTLDSGVIGKPYFLDSRLYGSKGLPGDWRSSPEAGGGMLYDWSIHLIDQILCLVHSPVEEVYCQALRVTFREVDDCNRILLTFGNGVRAQIVVDTWCYVGENRWHVSAQDGTLVMHDWLAPAGKIVKANREIDWKDGVIFTSTGRTRTMAPVPREKLEELPLPDPTPPRWEEFYENVADVLEGKGTQIVTHGQMLAAMRVLDACFLSAREGRVVKLSRGRA